MANRGGKFKGQTRESIHYSFMPNHRETMLALARARFTNQEYRVIIALMNQTDGYVRKEDTISTSFWQSITLMRTESLLHTIKGLVAHGVVAVETRDKKPFYRMNHPNEWPPDVFAPQLVTARALKEAEQLLKKEKEPQHFLWLNRLIESAKTLSNQTAKSVSQSIKTDSNPVQPDSVVQSDVSAPQIQTLSNQTGILSNQTGHPVQPDRVPVQPDRKSASEKPAESSIESTIESSIESSTKPPQTDSNPVQPDSELVPTHSEVDATEGEKKALRDLRDIKNWPFDFKKDLDYLRKLLIDFPAVDVLHEVPRFATYQLDHPIAKTRGSPRLRLRHWMEKTAEFTGRRGHYAGREQLSKTGPGAGQQRLATDDEREKSLGAQLH
ncbi:MAG TPA: hypothetical protein VMW64_07520 [Dehalococcoidia bacterium]|nr:hypothetical protein [Dehalococcoidia bacterium]